MGRKPAQSVAVTSLLLLTLVLQGHAAWASPGDLDPAFGGGDGWIQQRLHML